jgi:hypothetical protein
VEPLCIELEARHNNLIRRLHSLDLVYRFNCPADLRTATGQDFLEGLDMWLRQSLSEKGYYFSSSENTAAQFSYSKLAWRFVYYKSVRTTQCLGRTHQEKRRVLMSEDLAKFTTLSLADFQSTPFGSTDKRPKDPTTKVKKPVVYISRCFFIGCACNNSFHSV